MAVGESDHAAHRLVAMASASSTLGTITDVSAVTKLVHDVSGLVVVDHSAAAPYQLMDLDETEADVVALNAPAWGGGPPIGALVFRNPSLIDSFGSVSMNPYASGPERLELGGHQYGLLAGVVASIEYLAGLDESARGSRRERLAVSMQSAGSYLSGLFEYLMASLRSLPLVMVIGRPESHIPVVSFAVTGGAGRAGGAAAGRQRNPGRVQCQLAGARPDRRQRHRRCRHRRVGALLDDGRSGSAGASAGFVGLIHPGLTR